MAIHPLDFSRLQVFPLSDRASLTRAEDILIDPDSEPKPCSERNAALIAQCAEQIRAARARGSSVMLIYGAHLLRNGTAQILERMMKKGWISHLATNGAGTIHDWEYAWLGASTESVEMGVAGGKFGTWDETSTNIHLALLAGALDGLGYGQSLGRFIAEDGVTLPTLDELEKEIVSNPFDPLTGPRVELLRTMREQGWESGPHIVPHRWQHASILAQAWKHGVPTTVHPGIGYDIISNHPVFNGAAIGRGGEWDFKLFGGSVEGLDDGVVLSVGSAIMGPQVFEKSISCVNNIRRCEGRDIVRGHSIFVVDLQDSGNWDWTVGEPPQNKPGLLSAILQELFAHGRSNALPSMR